MENQFFTWDGWDEMDTTCFIFYKCTLVCDIGTHKAGEVIPSICVDYGNGKMEFYNKEADAVTDSFDLELKIK